MPKQKKSKQARAPTKARAARPKAKPKVVVVRTTKPKTPPAAPATEPQRQPRKIGRPTSCTPDVIATIARDVEAGCTFEHAAELNCVGWTTLKTWMARGETGEEPYAAMWAAVTQARAIAKARAIANVRGGVLSGRGDIPDWKAEAWWLERVYPAEFGPQQAVNVKVEKELDHLLEVAKETLDEANYRKLIAKLVPEEVLAPALPMPPPPVTAEEGAT